MYEQKLLCGSCGIQHHAPRDPGEVSPTCASSNKQTDLTMGGRAREPMKLPIGGENNGVLTRADNSMNEKGGG